MQPIRSVQYSTVQCITVQYSTVQYSTIQYSTVQYSTVQYCTVLYSTVQIVKQLSQHQAFQAGFGNIVGFTSGGKNQKDPGGSFPIAQFLAPMMPVYTVALMVFIGIRLRN